MSSQLPPREKGSSTHNPADPLCTERIDEEHPGEDFGQVCPVCHSRATARDLARASVVREIGS